MLSKILILIASALLIGAPALQPVTGGSLYVTGKAEQKGAAELADQALLTACIGPMTARILPKSGEAFQMAFGVGGCGTNSPYGLGLHIGKPAKTGKLDKRPGAIKPIRKSGLSAL